MSQALAACTDVAIEQTEVVNVQQRYFLEANIRMLLVHTTWLVVTSLTLSDPDPPAPGVDAARALCLMIKGYKAIFSAAALWTVRSAAFDSAITAAQKVAVCHRPGCAANDPQRIVNISVLGV